MNPIDEFKKEVRANIESMGENQDLKRLSIDWIRETAPYKYSYNYSWMGRPAIQFPQDMVAVQELIWEVKPDLIIEMGIAHGGSLIMNASYLAMLEYCDAIEAQAIMDPRNLQRFVLGVDIDIRSHNREAIEAHPMSHRIKMIQGSSISSEVIEQVYQFATNHKCIMVILDSNHTHGHVLAELIAYAPLVSKGSYCVVFDTVVEDMPANLFPDRPWGPGDNPKTAVREYLKRLGKEDCRATDGGTLRFEIDKMLDSKLMITVAPDGYLKRVS